MATADFYNRSGTLLGLPLNLLNDVTQYADFHKRSETSPSDFSIDEFQEQLNHSPQIKKQLGI